MIARSNHALKSISEPKDLRSDLRRYLGEWVALKG